MKSRNLLLTLKSTVPETLCWQQIELFLEDNLEVTFVLCLCIDKLLVFVAFASEIKEEKDRSR